jgi:dihydroorotase
MAEHFDLLIRGGFCVLPWGGEVISLGVQRGRITELGVASSATADEVFDASGLHVLPGLIDPHVHLRDPGDASVESIPTGTRAALLGGITTVFDMPNTSPAVTDAKVLAWKQDYVARRSFCDFGIYIGATKHNLAELGALERGEGVCAIKVFAGSSTGDLLVEDDTSIEAVLRGGSRRVAFHSEDEYRLQARKADFPEGPYRRHMEWRDEECAFLGTRRILALAAATGRPVHIVHVSTAEEFGYLKDFRGVATAEVLVNHLTQVGPECYDELGGYAVMNPPIRDRRHWEAAWAAVRDGLIDTIGSDHAPHSRAAKERPWPVTAAGLTGVQTALPVMLNHVHEGRLSLARMVDLMAAGPARVYGAVTKGRIAAGFDADFTIVDLKRERVIENSWIASPCGWTPFDGMRVTGWPVAAVLRGRVVMRDNEIQGAPSGRLAMFH